MEQRFALHYGCTMVGVWEKDPRHGAADIGEENADAPDDLRALFDTSIAGGVGLDFVEFKRRHPFTDPMILEIFKRGLDCWGANGAAPKACWMNGRYVSEKQRIVNTAKEEQEVRRKERERKQILKMRTSVTVEELEAQKLHDWFENHDTGIAAGDEYSVKQPTDPLLAIAIAQIAPTHPLVGEGLLETLRANDAQTMVYLRTVAEDCGNNPKLRAEATERVMSQQGGDSDSDSDDEGASKELVRRLIDEETEMLSLVDWLLGLVGGGGAASTGGGAIGCSSSEEYAAAQDIAIDERRNPLRSFDDRPFAAYMCHTQDTGGPQTMVMAMRFRDRFGSVEGESPGPWLDKWMPSCDAMAMEKGISECKVFFIMMTKGIMSKPYPIMEMRWAKMYGLPIIGVMDKSTAGGKDFIYDELEAAPDDLKYLCKDVEYIPYRTKGYEQVPMTDEIMRRGNLIVDGTADQAAAMRFSRTQAEDLAAIVMGRNNVSAAPKFGFLHSELQEIIRDPSISQAFDAKWIWADLGVAVKKDFIQKQIGKPGFRVAVIGPMKAGKSTAVNTMVGISLAPNRSDPMTQVPTKFLHRPGRKIPAMTLKLEPYKAAIDILTAILDNTANSTAGYQRAVRLGESYGHKHGVRSQREKQVEKQQRNEQRLAASKEGRKATVGSAMHKAKTEMKKVGGAPARPQVAPSGQMTTFRGDEIPKPAASVEIAIEGKYINAEAVSEILELLPKGAEKICNVLSMEDQSAHVAEYAWLKTLKFVGKDFSCEGKEEISAKLTHINDVCRIVARFNAKAGFDIFGLKLLLQQMFEDDFTPTVEIEMAITEKFPASVGDFYLIDTPGPDEARQAGILQEKVLQVLKESDAVIVVLNGTTHGNDAQEAIRNLVQKAKMLDLQENLLILLNRRDVVPRDGSSEEQEENKMCIGSAAEFLHNKDCGDHLETHFREDGSQVVPFVYPTSALQGLVHHEMLQFLNSVPELVANPTDRKAQKEAAKRLSETKAQWVDDWTRFGFGLDQQEKIGWKEFKLDGAIHRKQVQRWEGSRLQKPMEIVFSSWASKSAVNKLRKALDELRVTVGEAHRMNLRKLRTATSGTAEVDADILDMQKSQQQQRGVQEERKRTHEKLKRELRSHVQAVINQANTDVRLVKDAPWLKKAIKEFISEKEKQRPDKVSRGVFDTRSTGADGASEFVLRKGTEGSTADPNFDIHVEYSSKKGQKQFELESAALQDKTSSTLDAVIQEYSASVNHLCNQFRKDITESSLAHTADANQFMATKEDFRSQVEQAILVEEATSTVQDVLLTRWTLGALGFGGSLGAGGAIGVATVGVSATGTAAVTAAATGLGAATLAATAGAGIIVVGALYLGKQYFSNREKQTRSLSRKNCQDNAEGLRDTVLQNWSSTMVNFQSKRAQTVEAALNAQHIEAEEKLNAALQLLIASKDTLEVEKKRHEADARNVLIKSRKLLGQLAQIDVTCKLIERAEVDFMKTDMS